MNVFVDTSALLALSEPLDRSHLVAAKVWQRLIGEKHELYTTNYVLVETCALLQARTGIQSVRAIQSDIVPLLHVIWIDGELHELAVQALLLTNRRKLSLVDCSSVVVARRFSIQDTFAFDKHFSEQGFACLKA
jgi:uncharacterized protein